MPGQGLVQITGRKRVYVYPNTAPFITPEHLEDIALFNIEVDIPYKQWYDAHAKVLDIGPGQMLSWPMNAPHRVENLGDLSISMTFSYSNEEIRRAGIVNLANGMLRHRFGYQPKSRSLNGPSFLAKRVMQKLLRDGKWLSGKSATSAVRSTSVLMAGSLARSSICRRRPKPTGYFGAGGDSRKIYTGAKKRRGLDIVLNSPPTGMRRRPADMISRHRRRSSGRNGLKLGTAPSPAPHGR